VITNPIKRYQILHAPDVADRQQLVLWPNLRIRPELDGFKLEPKDEGIINAVHWYNYLSTEYEETFEHLKNALTIFLRKWTSLVVDDDANKDSQRPSCSC
jgi:nuclear pore complex protein Nup107